MIKIAFAALSFLLFIQPTFASVPCKKNLEHAALPPQADLTAMGFQRIAPSAFSFGDILAIQSGDSTQVFEQFSPHYIPFKGLSTVVGIRRRISHR